jgi:hypothetical protein
VDDSGDPFTLSSPLEEDRPTRLEANPCILPRITSSFIPLLLFSDLRHDCVIEKVHEQIKMLDHRPLHRAQLILIFGTRRILESDQLIVMMHQNRIRPIDNNRIRGQTLRRIVLNHRLQSVNDGRRVDLDVVLWLRQRSDEMKTFRAFLLSGLRLLELRIVGGDDFKDRLVGGGRRRRLLDNGVEAGGLSSSQNVTIVAIAVLD